MVARLCSSFKLAMSSTNKYDCNLKFKALDTRSYQSSTKQPRQGHKYA
jgi:hypothetical protein